MEYGGRRGQSPKHGEHGSKMQRFRAAHHTMVDIILGQLCIIIQKFIDKFQLLFMTIW